jgi:hypothetical protein
VPQPPFDQLALQALGVLANSWSGRELMFFPSIGFDLLSNIFVEMSEPFVRHVFHAHNQLLPLLSLFSPRRPQFTGEPAHGVRLQGIYGE